MRGFLYVRAFYLRRLWYYEGNETAESCTIHN